MHNILYLYVCIFICVLCILYSEMEKHRKMFKYTAAKTTRENVKCNSVGTGSSICCLFPFVFFHEMFFFEILRICGFSVPGFSIELFHYFFFALGRAHWNIFNRPLLYRISVWISPCVYVCIKRTEYRQLNTHGNSMWAYVFLMRLCAWMTACVLY